MPDIDVKIQYHSPDRMFAAVLIRDGEPWYLNGALVGMQGSPAGAVAALIAQAQYLVLNGENDLTEGQIAIQDRIWLFKLLDVGGIDTEDMYTAVRTANGGKDPYVDTTPDQADHGPYITKTGKVLTESEIYDLAQEAEEGYDVSQLRPRNRREDPS